MDHAMSYLFTHRPPRTQNTRTTPHPSPSPPCVCGSHARGGQWCGARGGAWRRCERSRSKERSRRTGDTATLRRSYGREVELWRGRRNGTGRTVGGPYGPMTGSPIFFFFLFFYRINLGGHKTASVNVHSLRPSLIDRLHTCLH